MLNFSSNILLLQFQSFTRRVLRGDLQLDVHGADVVELFGHDVVREFGRVAFAAQVREVELPQTGGHDLRGGFGGGGVGNVAVASENALLQRPRAARTFLQHLHVVVRFEDKDVRRTDTFQHELGHVAEVGGKADVAGGSVQQKADGVLRVVRNGKSFDAHVADFKTRAGLEQSPVELGLELFHAFGSRERRFFLRVPFGFECPDAAVLRAAIAKDWEIEFFGKPQNAGDVVGMFVREQNGGKIFRRASDAGEAFADLQRGKSGVHKDADLIGLDISAIPAGAAAEDGEFDGHGGKLKRKAESEKRKAKSGKRAGKFLMAFRW